MKVTFYELGFQLRPYGRGPCWHLFQACEAAQDGDTEPRWKALECFPQTLAHGMAIVYERSLMSITGDMDLASAMVQAQEIRASIEATARSLTGANEGL